MTRVLALAGQSKIGLSRSGGSPKPGPKPIRNGVPLWTETACRFPPKPPAGLNRNRLSETPKFALKAHPFGTVPAALSPDGRIGIFESNSIMRAVARLGHERFALYGRDPYEASRIDSFLDTSLVFARDAQLYLFALRESAVPPDSHARAKEAFTTYAAGIEQALRPDRMFLVGDDVTLADICFVAELSLFLNERTRHHALEQSALEPF